MHSKAKKKEYLVQVQIIEIRQITGQDGGTADPFVKITVGNLPSQVTNRKEKTTTAVFNQNFTFAGLKMTDVDFENFEIKIEVYDQKQFTSNNFVGGHSVGLSTLYRQPQHEIFNEWLTLFHPDFDLKPQGHLLASIYIIAEGDRPPVHEMNDNKVLDEPDEFGGVPDDQLNPEQLQKRREKKKKVAFVQPPEFHTRSFQLMVNLVKGEDFPIMTGNSCDSFISVRANGLTQVTATFSSQTKPQFKTRMLFPLLFPLNNDKIIIRVWDKRKCLSDTFIAQVPETPTENDFFNINFLQSRGGVLPFQWFNLYGIPMAERPSDYESKFLGYKKIANGTAYMGKILLSLNLTPSEKPVKGVIPQGMYREPPLTRFAVRLDAYEISEAKGCGEWVFLRVRVGGAYVDTEKAFPKKTKIKGPNGQTIVQKETGEAITYVWKENEIMVDLKIIDITVDQQQHPNIMLELYNDQKKRLAYLRIPASAPDLFENKPKWYHLKEVKFKGGDDMPEPTHSYALLNVMVRPEGIIRPLPRIPIKRTVKASQMFTGYFYAGYDLCSDLFGDEVQAVFTLKFGDYEYTLEQPIIAKSPIWNLKVQTPIFLDDNLEFASNIVISFVNSHPSQTGKMFSDNKIGEICIQAFHIGSDVEYDPGEPIKPKWVFYHIIKNGRSNGRILASFHSQKMKKSNKRIMHNDSETEPIVTKWTPMRVLFPIFGLRKLPQKIKQGIIFARIPLADVKVQAPVKQFDEDGKEIPVKWENPYYSQQSVQTKLPGGESETQHSPGYQDPNFFQLVELTFQQPPQLIMMPQMEVEIHSLSGSGPRYRCIVPLLNHIKKVDKEEQALAQYFFEKAQIYKSPDEELENQIEMRSGKRRDDKEKEEEEEEGEEEEKESIHEVPEMELATQAMVIDRDLKVRGIVNVGVDDQLIIPVGLQDKEFELETSDWKVSQLKSLLGSLPKNGQGLEVAQSVIKREIQNILTHKIEENKFFGLEQADDDGDEVFDYGRDVVKGSYDDVIAKTLPYRKFHVYTSAGEHTSGILKANIKVTTPVQNNSKKVSKRTEAMRRRYPFNLFDQIFLDYFSQASFRVKLRVYLYRCLSLAAQSEDVELKQRMAGQNAICSANAYIEIQVGDGSTDDLIKKISDSDRFMPDTLSPTFLRVFELDGELPLDWLMLIRIMNKGTVSNDLIGQIEIDLEDRLLGERHLKERISYIIYRDYFEKEVAKLKHDYSKEAEEQKGKYQSEMNNLTQMIDLFDKDKRIPVEYKELRNPLKGGTSQGTAELFVECLPFDVSRLIPIQPLTEPTVMEYEVRLVILETSDISIPEGKTLISIMVEASMDASATGTGKAEAFETDVHNGSKDGWGIFNWRMKFNFKTPCQFPRMKVAVYDFSAFGTNECIGEATISLKRILNILRTESKYDMPPTPIQLTHPNFPGKERGSVLLSIIILQKTEAEANPVGQARDEPNTDPFLPTPKEGRGIGDFLKIPFPWSIFINMMLRILIPGIISALIGFICFVKPGILMPKA